MANPSFVQLAPDSSFTGKKVLMEQIVLPDGTTGYRQVAEFGGETALILQQLLDTDEAILLTLQTVLANIQQFLPVITSFGITRPSTISVDDQASQQ